MNHSAYILNNGSQMLKSQETNQIKKNIAGPNGPKNGKFMKVVVKRVYKMPDDSELKKTHDQAEEMKSVLCEFANLLRANTKYLEDDSTSWENVKTEFWSILNDHDIDPWG